MSDEVKKIANSGSVEADLNLSERGTYVIEIVSENERIRRKIGDATFILRRIDVETHAKLTAKHTRKETYRDRSGAVISRPVTDNTALMMDSICYAIVGWEGVRASEGAYSEEDLPCTDEAKRKLPIPIIEEMLLFLSKAVHTYRQ